MLKKKIEETEDERVKEEMGGEIADSFPLLRQ